MQPGMSKTEIFQLFRGFSELDITDVKYIQNCEINDIHIKKLDFETVLADFHGMTFFEIFNTNSDYTELIVAQI